jgi:hypothetical protein
MMLLVAFLALVAGDWPPCLPALCQDSYAGQCTDLVCCNAGESCLRHSTSGCTAETSTFLCVTPGTGTAAFTTPDLQPYFPDEIFQSCGRYAEATEDRTWTGIIPTEPFRACNVYDTQHGYSNCG